MKRNILHSPRLSELKKKRRNVFLVKVLFFLIGFSLIITGLVYLSRLEKLNITGIEVVGNKIVDGETIEATAESELSGNYLWFFPKTNFLFYPKNKIINNLYDKFKTLKNISLSVKNQKILQIAVFERIALYTWCGITPPEKSNSDKKCYFLDETGFIFDEAPYFSGEVYFKFYGKVFQNYTDIFSQLILFKENLEKMGLKPIALYVADDENAKIFLSRGNDSHPEILFKSSDDVEKIAENLETALTTDPLQAELKKKFSSLVYIDLRFGNKVYYKFK